MILYQKRNIPFIVRLAMVIFHPGMLLLMAIPVGFGYLASQEKSSIVTGLYIAIVVMVLLISFVFYRMIVEIITRMVLIEVVSSGLRIDQMRYDQHEDIIIPTKDIDVEIEIHHVRKSRRTFYRLHIRHKGNSEQTFSMREDPSVIGKILDGIEQQKLISLRTKEKEFLEEYRKEPTSLTRHFNKVIWVIVLGVILYSVYSNRATLRYWINNLRALESPITGFWQAKAGTSTFEIDLLTDSTLNETLFGKSGKWKYVSGDSLSKRPDKLVFYNEEQAFNEFSVVSITDSILILQGNESQPQIILLKMKTSKMIPIDSVTRFIASFDRTLPIPTSNSSRMEAVKDIFPEKEGLMPVSLLMNNDTLAVATLSGSWDYFAVVLNPRSKARLEFLSLFHGEGCEALHTITFRKGQPVIVQRVLCEGEEESEKKVQCFAIEKSGKVVESDCK